MNNDFFLKISKAYQNRRPNICLKTSSFLGHNSCCTVNIQSRVFKHLINGPSFLTYVPIQ